MAQRDWTVDQLTAITTKRTMDSQSCNILVNAAAGSGKTAVLVERIIRKLIPNENNPVSIDVNRLLVVTFTNAAAAEMKERIGDALSEEIERAELEGDFALVQMLKRQALLLYDADITTIDAFCMRVVKEYFHLLGIDPNFGIADNARLALLAEEAMEELFEERYEEGDETFLTLAAIYSDGRDDAALFDILYEIYDFTRSMPDPSAWLMEKADMFCLKDGIENCIWTGEILEKKNALCAQAYHELQTALRYMVRYVFSHDESLEAVLKQNLPGEANEMYLTWGSYYESIYTEYRTAAALLACDWDESYELLSGLTFERWGRAARIKDKEKEVKDKESKDYLKGLRDRAKSALQEVAALVAAPLDEIAEQLRTRIYPQATALVNLVLAFGEKFSEKKAKKNVLDFSDVEHLCLRLFNENEEVCQTLQERYEEILMDEYQDSNGLQEEIFKKISRGDNFFLVGDMKQSIYRFRRSDPTLFKAKSDTFEDREGAANRKITLSENFRSRREVLDSVNIVFEKIMSEAVGDLEYDRSQRLNNGNKSYENMNFTRCGGYRSECYVLEACPKEDEELESVENAEVEASFIAAKIGELKKSGYMVRDGNSYRVIQNRDITILMSSYKNVAEIYISALNREGIDCFAESGGYFDKNEIRMILSLIKVIQNPYQDIPLLGVLRSPAGGFTDDELVWIRTSSEGLIFSALQTAANGEGETAEKCRDFLQRLERWRDYTQYMTCDRLLWTLYEETGLYAFVGALYGGEEAQANLRLLFERAKQYESSGYKGLFHFIRYIGKLEKREEDLSGAKLIGEGHDVVRIMTIHKSKGLEFPVVFLAGCGKRFLTRQKRIPLHKELGLGLEEVNFDENYRISSVAKNAVSAANLRESISEEERKLYVAMTRAKEKLIVTGVVKESGEDTPKCEAHWEEILPDEKLPMSPQAVRSAGGFIDWIAPVARRAADTWQYEFIRYRPYFPDMAEEEFEENGAAIDLETIHFHYPYADLSGVPTKISVTELKQAEQGLLSFRRDAELARVPAFMSEKQALTAAQKGSALHYMMQKITPSNSMDETYLQEAIWQLVQQGELTQEEAAGVESRKILTFYQSDIGRRLLKSKKVLREVPFETQISLSGFPGFENSDETILLQGIIDCYFQEEDGVVLLDYKSDYYTNSADMKRKYQKQVEWYAYAIERITGNRVKQKYIYLFFGDDIVEC